MTTSVENNDDDILNNLVEIIENGVVKMLWGAVEDANEYYEGEEEVFYINFLPNFEFYLFLTN